MVLVHSVDASGRSLLHSFGMFVFSLCKVKCWEQGVVQNKIM